MPYKTVLYPIRIPQGKYCWERKGLSGEICCHYDNEGGYSVCELHFCGLKDTDDGVVKSPECEELSELKPHKITGE